MSTKVVTVEPDDTLSHAANLLRQHQFHHLPLARTVHGDGPKSTAYTSQHTALIFEGLLTSQDIDLAVALASQDSSNGDSSRPWQEQRVAEFVHQDVIGVTPTTSVGAVAQLLVERRQYCLPVVEYCRPEQEMGTMLVGLLTRSDLLLALARAMGTFEPGMDLVIALPTGSTASLAETLHMAAELHVQVRSIIAAPLVDGVPRMATLRLGTIHPAPLLLWLQQAGIRYACANPLTEGEIYA